VRAVRGRDSEFSPIVFQRLQGTTWAASVPAAMIQPPGLEYYIGTVERDGTQVLRFASPESPHFVLVDLSRQDKSSAQRLDAHGGRHTRFAASVHHYNLGERKQTSGEMTPGTQPQALPDYFNAMEASVTYRFLKDSIYSVSFGYGMLGGVMGTTTPEREAHSAVNASDVLLSIPRPMKPGVYYGFGTLYWEVGGAFGIEPKLIMGASYDGFEVGAGGLARFGTLTGTHFDVALEGIANVGTRFITEFQWTTVPNFRMSLRNEVTDYPVGGDGGVLPSYNATLLLGQWELTGSVGYGVRFGHESGGLSLGAGLSFDM